MIELTMETIEDIEYSLKNENVVDFEDKYGIKLSDIEEIIDKHIDQEYIYNPIYHIVPCTIVSYLSIYLMTFVIC